MPELDLVTGASGFIGRALARRLAAGGRRLRCLLRPGADASGLPAGAEIFRGDLRDTAALEAAARGVSRVWHLGALVRPRGAVRRKAALLEEFRAVNEEASGLLAAAAARAGAGLFVYFSSISALGPGEGLADGAEPRPLTAYGRSKLGGERRVLAACAGTALRPLVLRPAMIYGAGSPGWAPLFAAARRGLVAVPGAAANKVSVCSLPDLLDAALLAADKAPAGAAFNVSSGPLAIEELVLAVGEALGRRPRLLRLPVGPLRAVSAGLAAALDLAGLYLPGFAGADPARLAEACASWSHTCEGLRALGWRPAPPAGPALAAAARSEGC